MKPDAAAVPTPGDGSEKTNPAGMDAAREGGQSHSRMVEMNEALLLGSLRQHELTEAAEKLNAQLRREIAERQRVEGELVAAKNEISRHAAGLEKVVLERTVRLRTTIGELEAFSYTISHDMRAPLRAMRSFSELLLEGYSDRLDEEGRSYLERIAQAAHRMDILIEGVLTYTRVLGGEVIKVPVDLDVLVRQIIETYPNLHAPGVVVQIEGKLPRTLGGEASVSQCISNLLTNAVKFVAPGVVPRVKVWAENKGAEIRLWVEDNGIGIASENQARIFNMFEQLDRATAYEGTGMGLAIVHKAVERMGGQMGVVSELGHGSKFWVQLPGIKS